jgi:predicted nucleic acid-binding protein
MTEVLDANAVSLTGRRILFDTNVWIFIFDFNAVSVPFKMKAYSGAYKSLLQSDNSIVVNDYIIGEFCNRCTRILYESDKAASADPNSFPSYKRYRQTERFRSAMESVRDTCLNIIDDHEFVNTCGAHYEVRDVLATFCDGRLDFSDLVIIDFCRTEDLYLMTDDADFRGRGLKLITANKHLLAHT